MKINQVIKLIIALPGDNVHTLLAAPTAYPGCTQGKASLPQHLAKQPHNRGPAGKQTQNVERRKFKAAGSGSVHRWNHSGGGA